MKRTPIALGLPIASGRAYLIKPTAWSATIEPFTQVALKATVTFEPVKHSRMLRLGEFLCRATIHFLLS
jgi:hypothetical protein